LKGDLSGLERQQKSILEKYKRKVGNLGINTAELDEAVQYRFSEYLDKFI